MLMVNILLQQSACFRLSYCFSNSAICLHWKSYYYSNLQAQDGLLLQHSVFSDVSNMTAICKIKMSNCDSNILDQ